MKNEPIVLASASPRRAELMELAGIPFRTAPSDIPEEPFDGEDPTIYALRLAEEKALVASVRENSGRFFIGADTIVVLDGRIIGKPVDDADAIRILHDLSGKTHEVVTAFSVLDKTTGLSTSRFVSTRVMFNNLLSEDILDYVKTGCPLDKAGGYAIQGGAAHFVRAIQGSYTNVVGLPTCELLETLRQTGAI